jgi:acyl carrier protein
MANHRADAAAIEAWLRGHVATLIGTTPDKVDPAGDFESFGIDSIQAVDMVGALEDWLGLPDGLPMEVLFDAETLADAAARVETSVTRHRL